MLLCCKGLKNEWLLLAGVLAQGSQGNPCASCAKIIKVKIKRISKIQKTFGVLYSPYRFHWRMPHVQS